MNAILRRLRDFIVYIGVVVAWSAFLVVAKIKWLLVGPPILDVVPSTLACEPTEDWLAAAEETDIETFVERRMKNRVRKVLGALWVVLHTQGDWVYYGRPIAHFGAGGLRAMSAFGVETWYRVAKGALEERFPGYATLDGRAVRRILREQITADPTLEDLREAWTATLTTEGLVLIPRETPDTPTPSTIGDLRLVLNSTTGRPAFESSPPGT